MYREIAWHLILFPHLSFEVTAITFLNIVSLLSSIYGLCETYRVLTCNIVIVRVSGKKNNIAMHVSFEIMNESWYKILLTCYMRFIIVSDLCPCEGRQNCKVLTFQADQDQSYEGIVNIASDKLVRPKQSHWQRTVNISPGHRGNLVPTAPDIPVSGC